LHVNVPVKSEAQLLLTCSQINSNYCLLTLFFVWIKMHGISL